MFDYKLGLISTILFSVALCHRMVQFKNKCPDKELIKPCVCYNFRFPEFKVNCYSTEKIETIQKINKHFKKEDRYHLVLLQPKFTFLPENFASELKVNEISFIETNISEVSDKAFVGCEDKLTKLRFIGSRLSSIPNINSLDKLDLLEVSSSPNLKDITQKQADDLPKNLVHLNLDRNDIRDISEGLFTKHPRLEHIRLAGNKIKTLTKYPFPPTLRKVHLESNEFESLPIEALRTYPDGFTFEFGYNHITTVPSTLSDLLTAKHQLYHIEGNPIECGCDMKWMARESGEKTYSVYGKCRGNNTRNGANMRFLTPYDFRDCN